MTNLYVLLTGGHTGLGLGVTKKLLQSGNKIGLIIRSESRKDQTIGEFSDFPKGLVDGIDFFYADLSDQAQVKAVAAEINEKWPRIDRLFNNAGILTDAGKKSKQGNEIHFEINVLSLYLLTQGLKPLLLNSADAKVINTGTGGMHRTKLEVGPLVGTTRKGNMGTYMQSKQAMMLLMNDLSADMQGVEVLTVNPGANKTNMTQSAGAPVIIKKFLSLFFSNPSVGSQRIYDAGFDPKFAEANAVYVTSNKIAPIKHGMTEQEKQALLAGIQG